MLFSAYRLDVKDQMFSNNEFSFKVVVCVLYCGCGWGPSFFIVLHLHTPRRRKQNPVCSDNLHLEQLYVGISRCISFGATVSHQNPALDPFVPPSRCTLPADTADNITPVKGE